MESDIMERLAGLLGPFPHHWVDDWGPEPRCRSCNFIKSAAPDSCQYSPNRPPSLTDDRFLGWAVKKLREAGWEWTKEWQDDTKWWAAFPVDWDGEEYRTVPATGNDAADFANLLMKVLEAKNAK